MSRFQASQRGPYPADVHKSSQVISPSPNVFRAACDEELPPGTLP
jgi:hypothetical protein